MTAPTITAPQLALARTAAEAALAVLPTSRPLEVTVNETVFAHAVPGNQGARLACLVVPSPKESSPKESGRP